MSETTGGFIDIAPLMLEKLRDAARKKQSENAYTWITPGHVLALLDTIDELEAALADTTARAIQDALALRARVAKLEEELADAQKWILAALKDAP